MTTLIFLAELIGFSMVAYWAYQNDRAGSKGGSVGFFRMVKPREEAVRIARKSDPRWKRQTEARAPSVRRPAAAPKARASQPRWKQPLR